MFSDHASSPVDPQTASRSSTATAIPRDPRLSAVPSTNLLDHRSVEILAEQRRPVGVA
ncbi:hypothetical protein PJK45_15195 [Mycobacterium kansasii]|uniref:Uncharacterized protein n=2 Tax=Mycobacterium kansasii TaxID=1768 RepID=U5X2F6_MYCKA|nr:hypothetical protein [Mycobacterium kansasii]AGZ54530.1 hypothetical protein MKAN_27895 [Mycobacterium kansasii ATCC 12478]ETZ98068.1 hypothetical protein I547_6611 [Mycobacterium kansasii 824]EUA10942.1 hypothetical protein I545_5498 [Mycobacterium kansasii 662]KEP42129.1 hypothetical protein MKSMC1_27160 [Mycobacterium kansasii]